MTKCPLTASKLYNVVFYTLFIISVLMFYIGISADPSQNVFNFNVEAAWVFFLIALSIMVVMTVEKYKKMAAECIKKKKYIK
jgi:hypothetical protein